MVVVVVVIVVIVVAVIVIVRDVVLFVVNALRAGAVMRSALMLS